MRILDTVPLESVLKSELYFLSLQHRHLYNAHSRYCPFGVRINYWRANCINRITITQISL